MQKIKFRAWDKKDEIMEYIDDLYWFEENGVHEGDGKGIHASYELMQFTGLWDDAGKEIYEGDIVEIQDRGETKTSYISKVYMYHDGVTVKHHPTHEALGHTGLRLLSHYCDYGCGDEYRGGYCKCKIIGNIHENKDLLEDEC